MLGQLKQTRSWEVKGIEGGLDTLELVDWRRRRGVTFTDRDAVNGALKIPVLVV
jgi:hypothetical protein